MTRCVRAIGVEGVRGPWNIDILESGNPRNMRGLANLLDMVFGESGLTLLYPYASVAPLVFMARHT